MRFFLNSIYCLFLIIVFAFFFFRCNKFNLNLATCVNNSLIIACIFFFIKDIFKVANNNFRRSCFNFNNRIRLALWKCYGCIFVPVLNFNKNSLSYAVIANNKVINSWNNIFKIIFSVFICCLFCNSLCSSLKNNNCILYWLFIFIVVFLHYDSVYLVNLFCPFSF